MSADDLARLVALVADDLDHRGYKAAGVVRRAAQVLAETPASPPPSSCPACGVPIVQPERGRRRKYCSTRCRQTTNQRRNAKVDP